MSDQLEKLLAQEPMKKPAKAWRNWWVALKKSHADGQWRNPGEPYPAPYVWPSKEIAEQKAATCQAATSPNWGPYTYLGAFPEGERP